MRHQVVVTGCAVALFLSRSVAAETIYESGTLGLTGISRDELLSQTVLGANVASFNFVGVRFQVSQNVEASRVGGHFVGGFSDTSFFCAIIQLTDELDFPNSLDLSTPDVVGTSLLTFPESSDDVFGSLSVDLQPGWYAVVFGSGLFGATGRGGALANNADIASPSYIVGQSDGEWFNRSTLTLVKGGFRFVVEGRIDRKSTRLN